MNATWNLPSQRFKKQRRNRRMFLAGIVVGLACLLGYFYGAFTPVFETVFYDLQPVIIADTPPGFDTAETNAVAEVQSSLPDNIRKWTIAPGDNLSSIFDSEFISQNVLCQIMAADESLLALDILRPGNTLTFTLDEKSRQLVQMELFFHPAHQVVYQRIDENSFDYEESILPGTWEKQLIAGEMKGSFYNSALRVGLSEQEAGNISDLFKSR